jgi:methylamine---glutamate N-methyltransferase subunit B
MEIDLAQSSVRDLNQALHDVSKQTNDTRWRVKNPAGKHSIVAGLNAAVSIEVEGHVGYYCAGMNQLADIVVYGNAGVGVAENMMSGRVHICGDASQSAGATAQGGLLIIDGNAAARCGISMKGVDIVVKGSIGPMSAFMAQAGTLVVLGDASDALGDSIYEARLFVRGSVKSLGADCEQKSIGPEDAKILTDLLTAAECENVSASDFRLYGSARNLYHFHVDNLTSY